MPPALVAIVLLAITGMAAGCGSSGSEQREPTDTITVFAAASLTSAFTEIAERFEAQHSGIEVIFSFAGTPTLRTQLEQGARADIFASANVEQMQIAQESGVVASEASVFARSSLVIITPASNPAEITAAEDLSRNGLKILLANERVPVGAYTRQMLSLMSGDPTFGSGFSAAVLENVISLESNVKQIAVKVALGEADAGVVYFTDVTVDLTRDVMVISVPERFNLLVEYPIVLVADGTNRASAGAFVDFVLSPQGQLVLKSHGFQTVE